MSNLEQITTGVIVLFILSVITEKFGTLIRTYPRQIQMMLLILSAFLMLVTLNSIYEYAPCQEPHVTWHGQYALLLPVWLFTGVLPAVALYCRGVAPLGGHWLLRILYNWNPFKHTAKTKSATVDKEDTIKEMSALSLFVGTIVAISMHVSLFDLFTKDASQITYGLAYIDIKQLQFNSNLVFDLKQLIGLLLTAFFLSFGSKFFHDLLDRLYAIKRYKNKLTNPETYQSSQDIDQLVQHINTPEINLAQLACDQYRSKLEKLAGVKKVAPGYVLMGDSTVGCIEVHFADATSYHEVESEYPITLSSGLVLNVPTSKFITGKTAVSAGINGAGSLVMNKEFPKNWGSVGCLVKDSTNEEIEYLLSNYHVMANGKNLSAKPDESTIMLKSQSDQEQVIGPLMKGIRNHQIDAALAKIDNSTLDFSNIRIDNPKGSRHVSSIDVVKRTPVKVYGGQSREEYTGYIHHDSWNETMRYSDAEPNYMLNDTIVLTRKVQGENKPLSIKGDSGSLVRDMQGRALGIVVGDNDCFTYAIKFKKIEHEFNIKLS